MCACTWVYLSVHTQMASGSCDVKAQVFFIHNEVLGKKLRLRTFEEQQSFPSLSRSDQEINDNFSSALYNHKHLPS